nr:NEP1-interacting protein-like 1 [Tanacetum cinerariifolium]
MDFYTYHPSRLSNSQISFGDLASKVKDFFLSTILGNVFSAIFTFFFATVGTLLGAMTGALIGQETESGFVRGAAVGAISGAVFSIEVFESSLLLWQSDESGVGCILYLIDVIVSLLSGRLVRERIGPAMLSAVQSQMGAVETSFDEVHNLFDIGGSKGLPEYSVEKIPKIKVTSKNNLDDSGDKVSCSVCLQDFQLGETVRSLPQCHHMFHLPCIDKWLYHRVGDSIMGKPSNITDYNEWTWIFRNSKDSTAKPIGLWNVCAPYGRVKDEPAFVGSLLNIWIGSYRLYVIVARFQRPNSTGSKLNRNPPDVQNEPMGIVKPNPNYLKSNNNAIPARKPSCVSIVHGNSNSNDETSSSAKIRSISLNDHDLISVDDSSRVLLIKLKEVETMRSIYKICKNEGFVDLKIHHVGGLWIWIQFTTSTECIAFQSNESMKSISTSIKTVTPSFKVDERRSVAFHFAHGDQTHIKKWLTGDEAVDFQVQMEDADASQTQPTQEEGSSDLSCPPGFEHLKKRSSSTSKCSTSFTRYQKKDIKGISLIHEMSRLIEVGGSLGLDVRGCRKSLKQMINGIGVAIVDK